MLDRLFLVCKNLLRSARSDIARRLPGCLDGVTNVATDAAHGVGTRRKGHDGRKSDDDGRHTTDHDQELREVENAAEERHGAAFGSGGSHENRSFPIDRSYAER
ncbi:hypothetical protein [Aureimonas jatrophae]|uniref:hypothetical protein n=1 Tax=Aureimonas jatrophae TaxID=1166073 RepID=UPI00147D467A|nr:hypothetical protein [Aureimonas jatrophae]MBB3949513.1 hypothetical protein [Aureimonas jatrophae]